MNSKSTLTKLQLLGALALAGSLAACGASSSSNPSESPSSTGSSSVSGTTVPAPPVSLQQRDPNGYQACMLIAQWSTKSAAAGGMDDPAVFDLAIKAGPLAAKSTTAAIKAGAVNNPSDPSGPKVADPETIRNACVANGVSMPPLPDQ